MDKKEQKTAVPAVGASSLLVIFAVLCMTVFALLGLSTVRADGRLCAIRTEAVADHYAADCRAEEILARLRAGERPEGVTLTDGVYAYDCPISEKQILRVEVRSGDWKILRWQAVSADTWQAEDRVTVWDGAAEP